MTTKMAILNIYGKFSSKNFLSFEEEFAKLKEIDYTNAGLIKALYDSERPKTLDICFPIFLELIEKAKEKGIE